MESIKKKFPEAKDYYDGIKIFLNDEEWVLIRTSQTNPEINLCAEGKNEENLNKIVKEYLKIINEEKEKV